MTRYFPRIAQTILLLAILTMLVGFCLAQLRAQTLPPTQDGINYYFYSEVTELKRRITSLEEMYKYGMGVLLANLVAHLFQIRAVQHVKSEQQQKNGK